MSGIFESYVEEGLSLSEAPQTGGLCLITMCGPHGTDIMASLMESLAEMQITVRDFSFGRMLHHVTFAALVELKYEEEWVKRLQSRASKWKATLLFTPICCSAPLETAPYLNRSIHAATLFSHKGLSTTLLNEFSKFLLESKVSVEKMTRLDSGFSVGCIEYRLSVPNTLQIDEFRDLIFQIARKSDADAALQMDNVFRRSKRLVVFDMDSTLIQQEVIDELAAVAGVESKVKSITEEAMRGEIDFEESLHKRVFLLKDLNESAFELVKSRIQFHDGARELCRCLKTLGYKLAVISGGFMPIAKYVKQELGLDYAFANVLSTKNGIILGTTQGPIVTAERKASLLEVIAQAESINLEQVVAVGDGANDLPMLSRAGLGIAFKAKPSVQQRAKTRLNNGSLLSILYLLGYNDNEIQWLMQ